MRERELEGFYLRPAEGDDVASDNFVSEVLRRLQEMSAASADVDDEAPADGG